MKNLISLLAAFFVMTNASFATIRTVSNDPLGGAQYNSLQAAYNAAANGDTFHLEGTNIPYALTNCWQRWEKSITVIGIGFNPQKDNPRRALIAVTACHNWFVINSGGNGSSFYGINFLYYVPWDQRCVIFEGNPSNLTFEDCKFDGHFAFNGNAASNITFRNCIFDQDNANNLNLSSASPVSNILISNCIFDGYIEGENNVNVSVIVDHCTFLSTTTNFSQLRNAVVSNCIFMNAYPNGTTNATYLNNLSRMAGTLPPSGNTGQDNIEATDPMFLTYTYNQFYSTAHDYHLQAGSAAIGAGNDGTDIGLHGGTAKFNESGEVLINPIMRSVMITNPVISPNGTLNVDIHAAKPASN